MASHHTNASFEESFRSTLRVKRLADSADLIPTSSGIDASGWRGCGKGVSFWRRYKRTDAIRPTTSHPSHPCFFSIDAHQSIDQILRAYPPSCRCSLLNLGPLYPRLATTPLRRRFIRSRPLGLQWFAAHQALRISQDQLLPKADNRYPLLGAPASYCGMVASSVSGFWGKRGKPSRSRHMMHIEGQVQKAALLELPVPTGQWSHSNAAYLCRLKPYPYRTTLHDGL